MTHNEHLKGSAPLKLEVYFQQLELQTEVVFPTAQLPNRKAMSHIVRICYLYGNIKQV